MQRKRVDGATVNTEFRASVKNAGGSNRVYPRVVETETQELFDCSTDELCAGTGGKKGDRATLPTPAHRFVHSQKLLQVLER